MNLCGNEPVVRGTFFISRCRSRSKKPLSNAPSYVLFFTPYLAFASVSWQVSVGCCCSFSTLETTSMNTKRRNGIFILERDTNQDLTVCLRKNKGRRIGPCGHKLSISPRLTPSSPENRRHMDRFKVIDRFANGINFSPFCYFCPGTQTQRFLFFLAVVCLFVCRGV